MKMGRKWMDGDHGNDSKTRKLCTRRGNTKSIVGLRKGQWIYKIIPRSKPLDNLYFRFQVNQDKVLPTYNQYRLSLTNKIGNRATSKSICTNHNITWVIYLYWIWKHLNITRTTVAATHRHYINLCCGSWEWLTQSLDLGLWDSIMA